MEKKETMPQRVKTIVQKYPKNDITLQKNAKKEFVATTYEQFYHEAKLLGMALLSLGIKRGEHVGIISDNRKEWLLSDYAILAIGAVDVPRGSDSTGDEIKYILNHAECRTVIAENRTQGEKILFNIDDLPELTTIIFFDCKDCESLRAPERIRLIMFNELLPLGEKELAEKGDLFEEELAKGGGDDLATILYTSGTTGTPKGVMLTHYSFLFQVDHINRHLPLTQGQTLMTVLPIWHSFERAVTYICTCKGLALAYSKPIGAVLMPDLLLVRPQWMTSVPRIWEAVRTGIYRQMEKASPVVKKLFEIAIKVGEGHSYFYNMFTGLHPQFRPRNMIFDVAFSLIPLILLTPLYWLFTILVFNKIKEKLGGRFVCGISGGGALPDYIDKFFQAAGIRLVEGYGLTETAPILGVRIHARPVVGTIGPLLEDIDFRILGSNGALLPPGKKGVLYVKSDHFMKGYYKQPEMTREIMKDGWLNTGDIAVATVNGEMKILGREKDTIVLSGGENVEPVPIEEKLLQSPFIDQAMVVGQDQKFLGALVVPNYEALEEYAAGQNMTFVDGVTLLEYPDIQELINSEIQGLISQENGFKGFERIFRFHLLSRPFEVGKELTASLKIKRHVVNKLYRKEIAGLFR